MAKVVLDKGSKGMKEWTHATEQSAKTRAIALAKLHDCKWEQIGDTFFVWAAAYYKD